MPWHAGCYSERRGAGVQLPPSRSAEVGFCLARTSTSAPRVRREHTLRRLRMKRQIFFGTLLSTALAVGVGAQQTPPSSSSTPGQSDRSGQTVTVTGCLQSGSGASGSTASSPTGAPAGQAGATSSSSGQYILANATMGSGSSATGTTGATPTPSAGASSSASTGKSYKLVGGD